MRRIQRGLGALVYWLDVTSTSLLLFILIGIWAFRQEIFVIDGEVRMAGLIMLAGFAVILLFDLASVLWLGRSRARWGGSNRARGGLLRLGLVCILFLGVEKVMADEVAHQAEAAWTIEGEYLMLYGMLFLQLAYNLLVTGQLVRRQHAAI
jgi:hypothetical protein